MRNTLAASDIFETRDTALRERAGGLEEEGSGEMLREVSVRRAHKEELKFSEKKYPHMPARESHLKEPPYPKSKNYQPSKQDMMVDIEERNPVWLKDKGDHFFEKSDFPAAINAYSKALENDPSFLKALLNRATCLLLVRRPTEALVDCQKITDLIAELPEAEQDEPFTRKVGLRATVKKAAAKAWLSRYSEAIEDYQSAIAQITASRHAFANLDNLEELVAGDVAAASEVQGAGPMTEQEKEAEAIRRKKLARLAAKMRQEEAQLVSDHQVSQLKSDIELVRRRMESQLEKEVGDAAFADQRYDEALEAYQRAARVDPSNEYAFGNIALVHLKRLEYAECVELCSQALARLESFLPNTRAFATDNRLEVKLRLRRGLCFEKCGDMTRAKADLDRCVAMEPYNTEARGLLKRVQEQLSERLFEDCRAQAVAL